MGRFSRLNFQAQYMASHQLPSESFKRRFPIPRIHSKHESAGFFCVLSHKALPLENVRTYYITFHYPLNYAFSPFHIHRTPWKKSQLLPPNQTHQTHAFPPNPNFSSKKKSSASPGLFEELLGPVGSCQEIKPPNLAQLSLASFPSCLVPSGKKKTHKRVDYCRYGDNIWHVPVCIYIYSLV